MLGWLKAMTGRVAASLSLVSPFLQRVVWTITTAFLSLATKGYGGNAVVYACLRLLSTAVPEPPLVVSLRRGEQLTPVGNDHPLQQLLRRPNPLMTEYEMLETIILHLGTVGLSTWWKQRNNAGQVIAVWPLRPDRVGPYYGEGQEVLAGWAYLPPGGGEYVIIPPADVFVSNLPNPASESGGMVEGLGPMQVLAREIEADNEATGYVGALLKNAATPGLLIRLKQAGINRKLAREIKQNFMAEFGGTKRGEPAVVDADADVVPLGFNLQQLEFPDLRDVAESRIAAAFGVPAILVGLKVGLQSGIRATIKEQREYFAETTLAMYWRRLGDQFTADLAAEFGDGLVVRFDTTQVKALAEQRQRAAAPIKEAFLAGSVLLDEYRQVVLNLGPLPDGAGQVLYVPNTVTILAPGERKPLPTAPPPQLPPPATGAGKRGALKAASAAATAALRQQARADAAADSAVDAIAAALAGQRETVLAALTSSNKAEIVLGADAGLPAGASAALHTAVRDLWIAALSDAYGEAGQLVGASLAFDLAGPDIAPVLRQIDALLDSMDETTRADIRALVQQANLEGWSMAQLTEAIQVARPFSVERAITIARTTAATANNLGAVLAYRASGLVTHVEVFDGTDDGPCAAANGSLWTLDYAQAHPLEHPRCRRAFAPIVLGGAQRNEVAA